jgi:tRNA A37 threonylcarbamoyladenosine dehydratase
VTTPPAAAPEAADLERRFGGLRRLYGDAGYTRLRQARVAVVGLGGVGSWAVEALARSGVAALVLIDLDQVAESNINRQVQALSSTLGRAKTEAMRQRIHDIHPGCAVHAVEEFVQPDNWPAILPCDVDLLIDACDQVRAKAALAAWAVAEGVPIVCVGAAGGKTRAEQVEVGDLAEVTHDPLLASLRQRLRQATRQQSATRTLPARAPQKGARLGVRCVFSRESVCGDAASGEAGAPLACHGYGSSVAVTATFGMVAAGEAISQLLAVAVPQKPSRIDL